MKNQAFNPYLPGTEYIPDAEPYVFGNRIYIYGSHDKFNGLIFCLGDYVCWSAPADDPSDWRYEGVIYRKNQDPKNKLGLRLLFAPDVARGRDGRYYLYYAYDMMGIMGVAVCDTPAGEYQFLGHVHWPDGKLLGRRGGDPFLFDPGVLADDDGRVYLYSGFYQDIPAVVTGGHKLRSDGGIVVELEPDMVTVKSAPKLLFPKQGEGSFPDHEFFEASSIRKIDGKYIFVYSSVHNHELCWAVSDSPVGGFRFGGTLVDQGDLYLNGNTDEAHASNYLGNTHGGMVQVNGQWYIFYHRQTNRHSYSRQACAEPLQRDEQGNFLQAEVTSCGLNSGPLRGMGTYEARIACNLWSKEGTGRYDTGSPKKKLAGHPYFTQTGKDGDRNARQYIANMRDGAVAGFKYFRMEGAGRISVEIRGSAEGRLLVSDAPDFGRLCARIPIRSEGTQWSVPSVLFESPEGVIPLYFKYVGSGSIDFMRFTLDQW